MQRLLKLPNSGNPDVHGQFYIPGVFQRTDQEHSNNSCSTESIAASDKFSHRDFLSHRQILRVPVCEQENQTVSFSCPYGGSSS